MPTRSNIQVTAWTLLLAAGMAVPATAQEAAQPATPQPTTPQPATPQPATPQPAPQPAAPTPAVQPDPAVKPEVKPADKAPAVVPARPPEKVDELGRRVVEGGETVLAFPKATVEQVIPFIAEMTGKFIIPQQEIASRRITVVNDKPVPRKIALDMLFFALQQAGVAVIENPDFILLRDQADIDKQPVPVVGPNTSILERTDLGSIVQKVFSLKYAGASNVAEIVKSSLPDNNNKIIADADSSQVIVTAPVAILQRIERTITALDKQPPDLPRSETYQLRYADADSVAQFIRDLYSDSTATRNTRTGTNQGGNQGGNNQQGGNRFQQNRGGNTPGGNAPGGNAAGEPGSGARAQATPVSSILRVSSNPQQNAVTVVAEAAILRAIKENIEQHWDKPLPDEVVTPKVFDLKYTDPIKIRTVLEGLFGTGTTGGGGNRQTVGRLSGQFTFQAVPEAGRLIVVGKSSDNLAVIERIVGELDKPMTTGLPEIIELKHVQAEDLAEQLNALLAQEGTLAQIRRINTDLSDNSAQASPFSSGSSNGGLDTNAFSRETPTDTLTFWWQRARTPTDNFGASNLVAKARIVPIAKSNSVMVLAPLEYKASIAEVISRLDKPGRQVLIAAVIAEISTDDALALGLRFSNTAITPTKSDNAIGITNSGNNVNTITGTQNNVLPDLFDTSVLNIGVNINALLQALNEKTTVKILSEPRIFTGDNQEASFFDGQDIPFITNSERNTTGNLVQSFDYRAVGIQLRVRPRITPERDVDLKVNLELASIQPQQTLFGGFIIDRRETTTQLIVRDGQTVVISGIMRSEDSDIKRKIPGLGDLPLIGGLFTSTERTKTKTELIAFITPVVVLNGRESDDVNAKPRERLTELRQELTPTEVKPPAPPDTRPAPTEDGP